MRNYGYRKPGFKYTTSPASVALAKDAEPTVPTSSSGETSKVELPSVPVTDKKDTAKNARRKHANTPNTTEAKKIETVGEVFGETKNPSMKDFAKPLTDTPTIVL